MTALPLATSALMLADWLELAALNAPDGNSSSGSLERALRSGGLIDDRGDSIEKLCVSVLSEMEARANSAKNAYPFAIEGALVRQKDSAPEYAAYIFCLCLSYRDWGSRRVFGEYPRRMFEKLSTIAAKNFLSGDAVRFGFPRDDLPSSFAKALNEVCTRIGEGGAYNGLPLRGAKDHGLDVVAWRDFPDRRPGKLLMFGQCASGTSDETKPGDLNPDAFWKSWIRESNTSTVLKAFFVPHRMDDADWRTESIKAGIVFDRCRLACCVASAELPDANSYVAWSASALAELRS